MPTKEISHSIISQSETGNFHKRSKPLTNITVRDGISRAGTAWFQFSLQNLAGLGR